MDRKHKIIFYFLLSLAKPILACWVCLWCRLPCLRTWTRTTAFWNKLSSVRVGGSKRHGWKARVSLLCYKLPFIPCLREKTVLKMGREIKLVHLSGVNTLGSLTAEAFPQKNELPVLRRLKGGPGLVFECKEQTEEKHRGPPEGWAARRKEWIRRKSRQKLKVQRDQEGSGREGGGRGDRDGKYM